MKRLAPWVLAALVATAVATPARAALRWGVETGVHMTRLTGAPYSDGSSHPLGFAGSLGPLLEWDLRQGVQLAVAPAYDLLSDREDVDFVFSDATSTTQASSTIRTRLHSLVVPATFRMAVGRRWRVSAGPALRIRLSAESDLDEFTLKTTYAAPNLAFAKIFEEASVIGTRNITDEFTPVSIGLHGGIGYSHPFGIHEWRIDLGWSEGVTNATHADHYDPRRARSLELRIGWLN